MDNLEINNFKGGGLEGGKFEGRSLNLEGGNFEGRGVKRGSLGGGKFEKEASKEAASKEEASKGIFPSKALTFGIPNCGFRVSPCRFLVGRLWGETVGLGV